jgi:hypothetical protein
VVLRGHLVRLEYRTTLQERAQKAVRSAMSEGLAEMVLGVAAMLLFYSPGSQLMFIGSWLFTFGAVVFTAAGIIAFRRTSGA